MIRKFKNDKFQQSASTIFLKDTLNLCLLHVGSTVLCRLSFKESGCVRTKPLLIRVCVHYTRATFILVQVQSTSLLWFSIRLHDTNTNCHTGVNHTCVISPQFLLEWSVIFILIWKFTHVSCKHSITVLLGYPLKCHQFFCVAVKTHTAIKMP